MTDLNWRGGLLVAWRVAGAFSIVYLILTHRWGLLALCAVGATLILLVQIWYQRRYPPCTHPFVRCVHGDEINQANGARVACLGCQQYLHSRRVLEICTFTGRGHDWDGRP